MPASCRSTSTIANSNGGGSDSDDDAITATGRHPGGVNAVLVDSSVRFVKATVKPITLWATSTIAGDEVVSADSY